MKVFTTQVTSFSYSLILKSKEKKVNGSVLKSCMVSMYSQYSFFMLLVSYKILYLKPPSSF